TSEPGRLINPCPPKRGRSTHVELKLARYEKVWQLNGEPMETAGEVIANLGLILEHLDREVR
ncbi:MAG: hypothetical protein WKF96_01090, partial [Solirubrobacteraceae bacterium]